MATWMDIRYSKLRRDEMEEIAAAKRFANEVRAAQTGRISLLTRLYGPLMVRAGSALEHWGARLTTRYAAFSKKHRQVADDYLSSLRASPMESNLAGK